MAWGVQVGRSQGWALLLALPAAGMYVRLFIIQHDCGHSSYFASKRANRWVGACLGLVTLFPFSSCKYPCTAVACCCIARSAAAMSGTTTCKPAL